MGSFATYLHPETCATSVERDSVQWVGQSLPHYDAVRSQLVGRLTNHPSLPVRKASISEFERVHSGSYVRKLLSLATGDPVPDPPRLSIECTGLEYALPGYQYSLGGLLEAVDRAKDGSLLAAYCFGLPGHHAYPDWGHGYCLLNPMAAAARYAQSKGMNNVLIIDWDHHHGDGTQTIFAGDHSVHCISVHSAVDLYMSMIGVQEAGTTVAARRAGHQNIPVLDQTYSADVSHELAVTGEYVHSGEELRAFGSALANVPWKPDIVFVLSGYDGHRLDCGSRVQEWDNQHFEELTRIICEYGEGVIPIVSVHGGGYQLPVTVDAAVAHVAVLAEYCETRLNH